MHVFTRIALTLILVLSLGSFPAPAVDLPTPRVTCVIGDFLIPPSVAVTQQVADMHYTFKLTRSLDLPDALILLLKKCSARLQLKSDAAGVHLYVPLPYAGDSPWKQRVRVWACTSKGIFLYQKTITAASDFTFIFKMSDRVDSKPASRNCSV